MATIYIIIGALSALVLLILRSVSEVESLVDIYLDISGFLVSAYFVIQGMGILFIKDYSLLIMVIKGSLVIIGVSILSFFLYMVLFRKHDLGRIDVAQLTLFLILILDLAIFSDIEISKNILRLPDFYITLFSDDGLTSITKALLLSILAINVMYNAFFMLNKTKRSSHRILAFLIIGIAFAAGSIIDLIMLFMPAKIVLPPLNNLIYMSYLFSIILISLSKCIKKISPMYLYHISLVSIYGEDVGELATFINPQKVDESLLELLDRLNEAGYLLQDRDVIKVDRYFIYITKKANLMFILCTEKQGSLFFKFLDRLSDRVLTELEKVESLSDESPAVMKVLVEEMGGLSS